ncbi:MAG: phosphoglucosamine mutase [Synoicihabitans sp.]
MNPGFAARLAYAAGCWAGGGRVFIGRDTRGSGPTLLVALANGFLAAGCEVYDLGAVPTPAVARELKISDAALGVVITASHNPASDNGIKFFAPGGIKLTDEQELAIEAGLPASVSETLASFRFHRGARSGYIFGMSDTLPLDALAGWKIVVDTANGATSYTTPNVLKILGAEVDQIGHQPDGTNINAAVGSEHPEQMAARVVAAGALVGIAHDGDGDRCILSDELGQILDGDEVLAILATDAISRGALKSNTLVVTKQSNLGVDVAVKAAGGQVVRTDIGDRYVAEKMREIGSSLGGESSGHIICDEVGPTGDGLGAALRILDVMHRTGKKLSELRTVLVKAPQISRAIRVNQKPPLEQCPQLQATMAAIETEFGAEGRLLVRYSGTEPKLRLLVEGPSIEAVESAYARLESAAQADLT